MVLKGLMGLKGFFEGFKGVFLEGMVIHCKVTGPVHNSFDAGGRAGSRLSCAIALPVGTIPALLKSSSFPLNPGAGAQGGRLARRSGRVL